VKIKLQVSMRESPVMTVAPAVQLEQDYFKLLEFAPAAIPSLVFEEAVAEKLRAASQRSKSAICTTSQKSPPAPSIATSLDL
jgi:predicted nucleotidyltransferase component of viral defense system